MPSAAITVEALGKAYRIGLKDEVPDTLVGAATSWLKVPLRNFHNLRRLNTFTTCADDQPDLIWALKDVSFEVPEGEVLGVIGRNGAGKSTLLKILSRITEPTAGRAKIHGRVSSLLEVGTGFHPELSGRENIYMNGTILGMRKREIDRKLDQIIDFSGIEKFLDTPIKRYSSGMKVRLAFAVAAHLEPEILIIDEVLAVGDAEFQKKCLGKMHDVAQSGRTVLFVSHNMAAVRSLTTRCAYLTNGLLKSIGPTSKTIGEYLDDSVRYVNTVGFDLAYFRRDSNRTMPVKFSRISVDGVENSEGELPRLNCGDDVCLNIEVESEEHIDRCCLSISIVKDQETVVTTLFSPDKGFWPKLDTGRHSFKCEIRSLPFAPGRYTANIGINRNDRSMAFDVIRDLPIFDVALADVENGEMYWPTRPWGAMLWSNVEWTACGEA